jgi:uncharacterized protein (PEP-CTERM system associated)
MAERRVRAVLLGPAFALALLPSAVRAAWRITPSVELRETWSDNPGLRQDGDKHSQFVTQISPGVTMSNQTPRFQFSASYQLNAFDYSDNRVQGTDRLNSSLNATAKGKLINDLLYFDAAAGISQTPISAFGPVSDSPYASTNKSEVRTYRISPYLVHSFGALATTQVRYTHDMVDADLGGFGRSTSDALDFSLNSGSSFRTWGWSVRGSRESLDDSIAPASITSKISGSLRYNVNRQFRLTGSGGYDKYDYESNGQSTKGASWSLGFGYEPSARTSLEASAGRRYYGNSYFLAATHRSRQTVWSINYSDDVSTSRSNFLLPQAVDTAAMLNQLFQAAFPDPLVRAAAVEAYIRAYNLPRALPNSTNYFSNRYSLQRQFNASMAWRSSRTTAAIALYKMRREALSLEKYDSSLLGSSQRNLNDNTDQTGMSVTMGYRVSARTNAALSASIARSKSLSAELSDRTRQYRAYVSHTFGPKLSGGLELRRATGGAGLRVGSYAENAVAASLSMRF